MGIVAWLAIAVLKVNDAAALWHKRLIETDTSLYRSIESLLHPTLVSGTCIGIVAVLEQNVYVTLLITPHKAIGIRTRIGGLI
jgi:hypothetical protein